MKNPAALLPKNKWVRGLAVGVLLIAATGIAVKSKAFGGSRPAPVSTFDVGTINIDDSQQVIIVRSNGWLDTKATLEALEWDGDSWNTVVGPITASLGRSGFSLQHREGDGSSPAGVFKISEAFGSRQAPDRTKLPYHVTGPEDWWVSDPDSADYNQHRTAPVDGRWREYLGERLSDSKYTTAYRHAIVIDYNRSPIVAGAGSAIFLHVGSSPTSGCIAIDENSLRTILAWLDPSKTPRIVMGPEPWMTAPVDAPTAQLAPPVGLATLPPVRVLDTRTGVGGRTGAVGQGETIELQVNGLDGVPEDASVVALNLTVTQPTRATYVRVSPSGTGAPDPTASNVNVHAGGERANLVLARVGPNGRIRIYNHAGSAHVVADLVGYGTSAGRGGVATVPPRRLLDTRTGLGVESGLKDKMGPHGLLDLPISGAPTGATAAIVNVTATEPTQDTFVSAFPGRTDWPNTSTVNLKRGDTVANMAIVPLGRDGTITLLNNAGSVHVVVDLFGFIVAEGGSRYQPALEPTRVLDTREGIGHRGQLPSNRRLSVSPPGAPINVAGAVFNLTGVNATEATNLRTWRLGVNEIPLVSNVNLETDVPAANFVFSETDHQGSLQIYNQLGNTDVVVDLQGWLVH